MQELFCRLRPAMFQRVCLRVGGYRRTVAITAVFHLGLSGCRYVSSVRICWEVGEGRGRGRGRVLSASAFYDSLWAPPRLIRDVARNASQVVPTSIVTPPPSSSLRSRPHFFSPSSSFSPRSRLLPITSNYTQALTVSRCCLHL